MTAMVTRTLQSNTPPQLATIAYEPPLLHDVDYALRCEWLEANGLGGYASGTIIGASARRYHALLVAAMQPPTQRMVLLSKVEEVVEFEGRRYELDTNLYHPDVVHPHGYRHLQQFRLNLFPSFIFALGEMQLTKAIVMPHARNAVIIAYELDGDKPTLLRIRLFTNARSHHHLMQCDTQLTRKVQIDINSNSLVIRMHHNAPALYIAFTMGEFIESRDWYYKFRYPRESERGLDDSEDLFTPGYIQAMIAPKQPWLLVASTEPVTAQKAYQWYAQERQRRLKLFSSLPAVELRRAGAELCAHLRADERKLTEQLISALLSTLLPRLWLSSDTFIAYREPEGTCTILAGYPWFTDWGRDAFISLPGLTLVTRRFAIARSVLSTYMERIENGMVPNFFPEDGSPPAFNTVDATFWFAYAAYCYLRYTRDLSFARMHLYEHLREIIWWHLAGTQYGIRIDDDGLLKWDAPNAALTWMDAKVGDCAVTARRGKPVEVNALWLQCLWFAGHLARAFNDITMARFLEKLHKRALEQFHAKFWNEHRKCLYDVLTDDAPDASVRPNQVIALMLPSIPWSDARADAILSAVAENLLTPMGLRTLAPDEPDYHGRYFGDQVQRDAAYHQGTVWAWLIGPFITAYVRRHRRSRAARLQAARWLVGFVDHLRSAGLGTISEIFDANPPYHPRGCIAQAWSVAEIMRALMEDVCDHRPPPLWDECDA